MKADQVSSGDGTRRVWVLTMIARLIEGGELEHRLSAVEAALREAGALP